MKTDKDIDKLWHDMKKYEDALKRKQQELTDLIKKLKLEQCVIPIVGVQSEQLRFLIDKFQTPKGNYIIDLLMEHKESKEKP